ncbi:MAG: hypothetical protein ACK45J_05860 [Acidimicrobiaceae bacterium]|jgi:hypothetical protein|nr:hypothetical protein [Ilumatobacteraceae bacterium]
MQDDGMEEKIKDHIDEAFDERMPRSRRHLWLVQLIEYAIGFAIAFSASRAGEPLVPAIVAAAVIANAATVKAPLSAFRVSSPQVHRAIGIVLAAGTLASAIFLDVDAMTKALLVISAVAEGFVSVRFGHGI